MSTIRVFMCVIFAACWLRVLICGLHCKPQMHSPVARVDSNVRGVCASLCAYARLSVMVYATDLHNSVHVHAPECSYVHAHMPWSCMHYVHLCMRDVPVYA